MSASTCPAEKVLRIASPAALLAAIPHFLGFQPGEGSLVVMGVAGPSNRVRLTLRLDMPASPSLRQAEEMARHVITAVTVNEITTITAAGYGPGSQVTPLADALRARAAGAGIRVQEFLRAEGGRYWSYLCTDPSCCPPDGVPFDNSAHPVTAAFEAASPGTVLCNRADMAALIIPADGEEGASMEAATSDAVRRVNALIQGADSPAAARRLICTAGLDAVTDAVNRYRNNGSLTHEEAAWLSVALKDLRIRDDAWSRMDPEHSGDHLRLWTDLTRLARPGHVAPAASLLAFVAWQRGNGALANIALDRAQADDPRYSMAALIRKVITDGIPPDAAKPPMTPEEVAASYADDPAPEG